MIFKLQEKDYCKGQASNLLPISIVTRNDRLTSKKEVF